MSAVARTRQPTLIRHIPDGKGNLVTYAPAAEVMRRVGISATSLSRWAESGCIRVLPRLAGSRGYAIADAARLKIMPPQLTLAMGIQRIPERFLAQQRAWAERTNYRTMKHAGARRQAWDDYDVVKVIEMVEAGEPFDVIAKEVGRTYFAICGKVENLRESGDLPPARPGEDWWSRCREVLTAAEITELEGFE